MFQALLISFFPAPVNYLLYTLLALSPISLTSATPNTFPDSHIEDRQLLIPGLILGFFGAGIITGQHVQYVKDVQKYTPKLKSVSGSSCYKSGSWSFKEPIVDLANNVCQALTSRALTWQQSGNISSANPNVVASTWSNGTSLTNEAGFLQTLTFGLFDQNGDKGRPFYGMDACMTAVTTLLYDCAGGHGDTKGGLYFWGYDGVAGYNMDPTCVDSPGKTCGAHI